jgi:phage replication-related protein YjqB (UPF0714/DUF867 family)
LIFAGPIGELLAQTSPHVDVQPEHKDDMAKLTALLHGAGYSAEVCGEDLRIAGEGATAADINRMATSAGITLSSIVTVQESLESVFLKLTGESDGELAQRRAATSQEVA